MTEFTQKIYNVVRQIPEGRVMTYAMVARCAGYPQASRAVGNVLSKNPFAFGSDMPRENWVPCHRVVKSNGYLGGFMGGYRHCGKKQVLLEREGVRVRGKHLVDFEKVLF